MTKDIQEFDDIKLLVNSFYEKVRQDDVLKDIFEKVIQGNWDKHLEKMYSFWQTILLEERTYSGQPFMQHIKLPIERIHFVRWLELFFQTVDEHFTGHIAEEAKQRAHRIAKVMYSKIVDFKKTDEGRS